MQFQVTFAVLAAVMCFAAAAPATEEVKSSPSTSAQSAVSGTDRGKRFVAVAAPYVAATPYAAAAPYVAAAPVAATPYVAAAPYAAAPYVAAPYAAAPYAVASPYAAPYVSSYTTYPYVAKTLASPYAYFR
ncbi:testis-specific gene A8 protein-like isoform X1 [Aphis gossypii]|uniref:testis-specific gene A8 protein-like isoform X1 n=1 Tax=Aphis gossypii TaxID=80765 RepID=UPI002158EE11|nr:testis-specific gene A8 protein-like isoform X1 [Aphis gossypii]